MEKTVPKYKIVARMLLAVFWVLGTYLFPIQELVPGAADAARATGSIVSDALIILAGLWTLRARIDIALYIVLLLIGGVSAWYNDIPAVMAINGLRAYLLPLSLLIIVRYLLSTRERVRYFLPRFEKSLYIFLLLQFPVMVIQCLRWGAYDNVGGSLGWMRSGTISTLIYLISFYLMVRRWDDSRTYLENLKQNYMLLVCLFPSMLNETKISFVYLAMYFFFLVPMDRMFLKRMLYVIPLMLLSIGGALALYITILGGATIDDYEGTQTDVTSSKFISEYMVGNDEVRTLVLDGYMETVMPDVQEADFARGLKYAVLPIILSDTPHAWYVGFGPSQFKGGTTLETTPFAKEYEWLLRGTEMSVMSYLIEPGGGRPAVARLVHHRALPLLPPRPQTLEAHNLEHGADTANLSGLLPPAHPVHPHDSLHLRGHDEQPRTPVQICPAAVRLAAQAHAGNRRPTRTDARKVRARNSRLPCRCHSKITRNPAAAPIPPLIPPLTVPR